MRNRCRVCSRPFLHPPLLVYENIPRGAQLLPAADDLGADRGVDLQVVQCSGCGLVQLPGAPVPYYRDVIRASAVSGEMTAFRLEQFGDFVERFGLRDRKVVEIGCGRGEYLELVRRTGAEARGLEHSASAVLHCREAGLPVSRGFVRGPACRIPGGPFSAFLMLNYLEHLPAPNAALAGIRANLDEGGVGLVEVPNFDMIVRRGLFSEFIPDHLAYFTAATLRGVLEWNGFEVLECREVWHDYILSAVVRRRDRLDLGSFQAREQDLRREIDAFLGRYPAGAVAVWGAGHQALTVLSLAKLTGKVRYVVDSAPFKQGRFTPATHIPIVPPDRLDADPVDAVIVMAASYSDEVARRVLEACGGRPDLAIVRDHGLEIVRQDRATAGGRD